RSNDEGGIAADRERLHLRVSAPPRETSPRLALMPRALRVTQEPRRARRMRRVPLTRRTLLLLQPVIPDLVQQGARAQFEELGGAGLVAARALEGLADQAALEHGVV